MFLRVLIWSAVAAAATSAKDTVPALERVAQLDDAAALETASVGGKYRLLLRKFKVERDRKRYGAFRDFGSYVETKRYQRFKNLPAGYWVYVYPYWYIWAHEGAASKLPWSAAQATGAPDTRQAADATSAWAPKEADRGKEWLMLGYKTPVRPIGILVYESFNPGALVKVTAFRPDGAEVTVWEGKDPTPAGTGKGVSLIPVRIDFQTMRIKLHLDTRKVKGWNEIDAVGLLDAAGKTRWANAAQASSEYAVQQHIPIRVLPQPASYIPTLFPPQPNAEVEALKKRVAALEKRLAELEAQAKAQSMR